MLTKRIIPCLDVKDGKTVKGVNFLNLRDAGDPVELGALYSQQGADELVFLDITATLEKRGTLVELVKRVAQHINIPFTIGGGIGSIEDVSACLNAGADKVSVNSSAIKNPALIDQLSKEFGNQCIVVAIDTRNVGGMNLVHSHGGTKPTDLDTIAWAKEMQERGAGELLLTSMDKDGTKAGFANELTAYISTHVSIPIIASGGAGTMEHFTDVFTLGKADAALAASIFHFKEIAIPELKSYLSGKGIHMRK
ncbi:imidazole glycerol phosphate synthase subunit HisF [Cytophaga hutchinsonii]|uniref:Imidazole glycerol phosphate synthase subunit HisF n=1 Tax=Cytophaga hutchinsonii (strain ATCC 33406 / DSM 1761 / CIP 103989 / NBRC 15051 / NCIMB 9469 / D465) TaxID=269798 RepID=HIS6_CYTH3|nr:imidazole glycerol phosphate synthase subunit HisF [Cytophaga hutchinsonii]Q11VM1.1 RecName: Full=Imidazole glycerol phosphate synthase subunit HisF; AltName: Full=IGP synthase cyclase subunit; AltName: Full=IGP synthase subunit HisF; AltName: Full=ImGP synthase subunit HisF; Short=IGPS subunit HisF [Cytophaga hutchinsonii ATCC 33406]ABG58545.1 imidazole glycerol phosphate synthase, subunit B [Cytophaga hutchinsonii ATCC 33406]SFX76678.1 cyclase [Cytophaga hutchinsonii ATCC 33406]